MFRSFLILLSLASWGAFAGADKCEIDSVALPDAEALARVTHERAESLKASNIPPPRFGEPLPGVASRPPVAAQQSASAFGIVMPKSASAPTANDQMRGMTKEVTVEFKGRTVHARIPITMNESALLDGLRREEAARSPMAIALDVGDVGAVKKLIAAGADVKTIEDPVVAGRRAPTIPYTTRRWQYMHISSEGNAPKQKDIGDRYSAIIAALLAVGADAKETYYASTALSSLPQQSKGVTRSPRAFEVTALLLDHGAPLDAPAYPAVNPLGAAAKNGDVALMDVLLQHGHPSQKLLDDTLFVAFVDSSWDAAVKLLEAGANPNAKITGSGRHQGPLLDMVYTTSGRSVIKSLLAHKANPDEMLTIGTTPLVFVMHDHELMKAFLKAGANPNRVEPGSGMAPLHYASAVRRQPGFETNAPNVNWIRIVAPDTRAKSVSLLLSRGANPNSRSSNGLTPLMYTSAMDGDAIAVLLDAGAEMGDTSRPVEASSPMKNPVGPVGWALLHQNETLASAWLNSRGLVDPRDCGVVYYAAAGGQAGVLKALLERGASAEVYSTVDYHGVELHVAPTLGPEVKGGNALIVFGRASRPINIAAAKGHKDAIEVLLDTGKVAVDARTPRLVPSVQWTQDKSQPVPEMVVRGLLSKQEVSDAILKSGGETALMTAARAGRPEIVNLLLKRGASPHALDNAGRTAVNYANDPKAGPNAEVLRLLTKAGGAPGRRETN